MRLNTLQQTAVTALEDIKARDIKVLDVRPLTSICDSLIIASAESNRQVKALAHHVRDKLKEAGAPSSASRARKPANGCWWMPATSWCTSCSPRCARTTTSRNCGTRLPYGRAPPPEKSRGRTSRAMKLRIVALGHRMPSWVAAGFAEYAQRMPRELAVELVEMKPEPRDRGRPVAQILAAEAVRLRAACAGATVVALDERGAAWTTRDLAAAPAALAGRGRRRGLRDRQCRRPRSGAEARRPRHASRCPR